MGAKKKALEDSSKLLKEQFEFQKSLLKKREGQRDSAINAMSKLLGDMPKYEVPAATKQYIGLMNALGGELSQLRDPSNRSSINMADYAAMPEEYDVLKFGGIDPGTMRGTGSEIVDDPTGRPQNTRLEEPPQVGGNHPRQPRATTPTPPVTTKPKGRR